MKNILSLFRNLFKSKEISRNEILAYAARQLSAMIESDPDGVLADRVTETTSALNDMETTTQDEGSLVALQKVRTQAKKSFRSALPAQMARFHGLIVSQYGAGSLEETEFFPKGRSIFRDVRDEQLDVELKTVADAFQRHAADLPAAQVSAAAGLVTTWNSLLGTQTTAKTSRELGTGSIDTARAALERALQRNLHWIGYHFGEDLAKCEFYCPQYLLENRAAPVTPGGTTLSAGPFDPQSGQTVFTMTAADAETFRLYRRLLGEADFSVIAEEIEAVDGTGTYTDTMAAPGTYEYRAEAVNGTRVGARSGVVSVAQG